MMQHKASDFFGIVSEKGIIKLNRIAAEEQVRIKNLGMASRRIVAEFPEISAWFCLTVDLRKEFYVEKFLYEENVEALVPTRLGEERRCRGRIFPAPKLPVLPGYVLVQCANSPSAMAGLRSVKHVAGFVGGNEKPYRVPSEFVDRFRQKAKAGDFNPRRVDADYRTGQRVFVVDGPFASFPAIVVSWDGAGHRVEVEIDIFGRHTSVELDVAQIEKV